jgi:hypothetical protein
MRTRRIAISGKLALLLLWALVVPGEAAIRYLPEQNLGWNVRAVDLAMDALGRMHVAAVQDTGIVGYRRYALAGWDGGSTPPGSEPFGAIPTNVSVPPGERATLAVKPDGTPFIAWNAGPFRIDFVTVEGAGWGAVEAALTVSAGYLSNPRLALGPQGNPTLTATQILADDTGEPNRVLLTRRINGRWTSPHFVSDTALEAGGAAVAHDAQGLCHITWFQTSPQGRSLMYRTFDGTNWSTPEQPVRQFQTAGTTDLVLDRLARPHVAYPSYLDNGPVQGLEGINYTRYTGGIWSRSNFNRNILNFFPVHPRIAANNQGFGVFWNDYGALKWYFHTGLSTGTHTGQNFSGAGLRQIDSQAAAGGLDNRFFVLGVGTLGHLKLNSVEVDERAVGRPAILAAGYGFTEVSTYRGGELTVLAAVSDPNGLSNVAEIEILYAGQSTGWFLRDDGHNNDFAAGDGVYGWRRLLPGGIPTGSYLLELRLMNKLGIYGHVWPYFTAEGGVNPAPPDWQQLWARSVQPHAVSASAPRIPLAGYLDSRVTVAEGGTLTMLAWVSDPDGGTSEVEILVNGVPSGVKLPDDGTGGDLTAGDGVHMLSVPVGPGLPPVPLLLELQATDRQGNVSGVWPYFNVVPGGTDTPTPTPTPTSTPTTSPGLLDCSRAPVVQCGVPYQGDTRQVPNDVDLYSCNTLLFRGPEMPHEINVPAGNVRIELVNFLPAQLDLILLRNCSENDCLQVSSTAQVDRREIFIPNSPAGRYYVVVEGRSGSDAGPYTLYVSCNVAATPTPTPTPTPFPTFNPTLPPGSLDCSGAQLIPCGGRVEGDTALGRSVVRTYGQCGAGFSFPGHELVYRFRTTRAGRIETELSNASADLDLFILSECNEHACLNWGDIRCNLAYAPAGQYYIVVDSRQTTTGTFTLEVRCP